MRAMYGTKIAGDKEDMGIRTQPIEQETGRSGGRTARCLS